MLVTEEVKLPMTENTTHTSGSHTSRYSTTSMLSKVVVATEVQPMTKIINKTCIFCKGFHYSDQCSKYNSLESRKQTFKDVTNALVFFTFPHSVIIGDFVFTAKERQRLH
uniref:Uncharacterized protein n=1 Tax=Cacopsylla melanoneura TaxID=428564 RepID=A0A8D9BGJ9_9HEMI